MLRGSLLLQLADLNIKIGLVYRVANIWILCTMLRYLCSLICSRFWGKLEIQIGMGIATRGQHRLLPLNILHEDSVLLHGREISILSKILVHVFKCERLHIHNFCFLLPNLVGSLLDSRLIYIICSNRSIRSHIEAIFILWDILIRRPRAKSCESLSISRRQIILICILILALGDPLHASILDCHTLLIDLIWLVIGTDYLLMLRLIGSSQILLHQVSIYMIPSVICTGRIGHTLVLNPQRRHSHNIWCWMRHRFALSLIFWLLVLLVHGLRLAWLTVCQFWNWTKRMARLALWIFWRYWRLGRDSGISVCDSLLEAVRVLRVISLELSLTQVAWQRRCLVPTRARMLATGWLVFSFRVMIVSFDIHILHLVQINLKQLCF